MLRTLTMITLSSLLFACSGSDGGGSADESETKPGMSAASSTTQSLWGEIEGYSAWEKFPEQTERVESVAHSGMYVVSYYNDVVATAMSSGEPLPLPDGAIIVKENFMAPDDEVPMALTVMSKVGSEWYWVQGTPDGEMVFDGPDGPLEGTDVGMCVSCHSAKADNDYVMVHDF